MVTLSAEREVAAPPERVFAFLSDLRNHWKLESRFVDLDTVDADAAGGRIRIRGPLGAGRVARTRVVAVEPHRRLEGRADVGRGTVGLVRWELEPAGQGCRVRLSAQVAQARGGDRVLLALGGRAWLQRIFERALERLDAETA